MSVTKKYMPQILFTLKCLLFSSILTGGFLLLLAFLLYRLLLSERVVNEEKILLGRHNGGAVFCGAVCGICHCESLLSAAFHGLFDDRAAVCGRRNAGGNVELIKNRRSDFYVTIHIHIRSRSAPESNPY